MRRGYEPCSVSIPGVTAIRELLFTFVGPSRIWIVARININDGLRSDQVGALARGIESGMKHESKDVDRVDGVPHWRSTACEPVPLIASRARRGSSVIG